MLAIFLATILGVTFARAELPFDPVDTELEKIKPRPADTLEQATVKCARLAAEGRSRGARTLLVGFEGQGGFKGDNAWLVYRYLWRITHGISDAPPVLDTAAPVLNRLLLPLIDYYRGHVEILDFPETSVSAASGGVPEACVAAWMGLPGMRVILVGHSFGGAAAHDLAVLLNRRAVPVAQVYSIDPIARGGVGLRKPANVSWWTNFFQQNEPPFGVAVSGANENTGLSYLGVNHRTIVRSPPVIGTMKERLGFP